MSQILYNSFDVKSLTPEGSLGSTGIAAALGMMSDLLCSSFLFFVFSYSRLNESVFHTTNDESNPKKIGECSKEFATYLKQANVSS